MSSRFPRNALTVFCLFLCASAALARTVGKPKPVTAVNSPPAAADDSSRAAHEMLLFLRGNYGGVDNWNFIEGMRYYATFRIPGPDSTQVSEWAESHMVWAHDRPRVRIDNATDSTVVVVTGDTTFVRQGGQWTTDPAIVEPARALALEAAWLIRVPWNLLDWNLKRRLDPPYVKDGPLSVRIDYGPGQERPAGSQVWVRFDPPSYALRQVRWYDPRSKNWYLMELAGEQQRYKWTWSTQRRVYASDAEGKKGPLVLDVRIDDMHVENQMPTVVLAPPNAVAVRAPADTVRTR